jgi:hypothetical protein
LGGFCLTTLSTRERKSGGYVIAPGCRRPDGGSWTVEKDSDPARIILQPKWETEPREPCDPSETPAGLRELEALCRRLTAAPNGQQNAELYRVAAEAGSLVGAGDCSWKRREKNCWLRAGR